ncbi:potassium channel family protein [Nesterenkonia xinjiangensis]|uniref:GNAT superfamily N-acetyltransferase n=1 Tax=Nesterenkonia xinjiangensis TaxID=225327 RepID=A0A7Z0K7R2_9MICC|nr:potassium channel family protein [Nesterenkonia xinjiangensis]NYJ76804.1 GNAT superfamily N-acetyltransferase [Nesterenkonia xinjiangensis]
MFGLTLMFTRFLSALRTAWQDLVFRGALLSLLMLVLSATIFYTLTEGWTVLDALYFSVVSGLTVGYGDLTPSSPLAKIFTMLYAMLAVGLFVTIAASLGGAFARNRSERRVGRRRRRRDGASASEPQLQVAGELDEEALDDLRARVHPDGSASTWSPRTADGRESWVAATISGRLVGFVRMVGDGDRDAVLIELLLDPEHHQLGEALVQRAAEEARAAGHCRLFADFADAQDRALFKACGFSRVATGVRQLS